MKKSTTIEFCLSFMISIASYLFWSIPFRAMLNYHEEFQLFFTNLDYFFSHLEQPGGLSVYLSEFLVQFYNNYWIGALILTSQLLVIQRLALLIMKYTIAEWSKKHPYLIYATSLIPMVIVWMVIGDINVKHSLIIAVIIALALSYALIRSIKDNIYRCIGSVFAVMLFIWTSGTTHYRVPGISLTLSNIYNQKTIELLDYDFLVRANRWQQIIQKAEKQQPDLPMSVCATNLALGMMNQLGDRAFSFFQNGTEGLFPSFSKDHFSSLTTAEVFFQLGLINTAQRYYFEAMEASPDYAKSCRCIRRLSETNLINGQYEVARKYLHLLEKTTFYKKWAHRILLMIDQGEMTIMQHPLYGRLRRMKLNEDFLYSDIEIDKICGRLLMQNYDNVLSMQYMLLYPLLEKDYNKFALYMQLVRQEVPYSQEYASFEKYLRNNKIE